MVMDPVAAVLQPSDAFLPAAHSHVCTHWQLTPYRLATSATETPLSASSTAWYLCSVTLNPTT